MFWSLTFREFHALLDRKREVDQRPEYYAALISTVVHNTGQLQFEPKVRKFAKPADFMASPVKRKVAPAVQNNAADIFSRIDSYATMCGINNEGEQEARERLKREAEGCKQ